MKHKVSELQGALLDASVAMAEGIRSGWLVPWDERGTLCFQLDSGQPFRPSTDWANGGPIIERERLELRDIDGVTWSCMGSRCYEEGPTPLIAAMRAFVASKLGQEVEFP